MLPGETGLYNAITDVAGVEVGFSTIITGEPEDYKGPGSNFARTGVTAILPRGKKRSAVFAGRHGFKGAFKRAGRVRCGRPCASEPRFSGAFRNSGNPHTANENAYTYTQTKIDILGDDMMDPIYKAVDVLGRHGKIKL
ncbi:MAG: P1 family peptidase [Clostridiales bacterium]|nr:P1 family peptidase [Clostridiales bacterium]